MKFFTLLFFLVINVVIGTAQITTPIIKANFGVDADLRANYFDGFVQAGNDDWFSNGTPGSGQFIIDTSGASYITSRYVTDANFRKIPFFRTLRFPKYSVINNRLLVDAIFTRDYHGDDSTIFASGSNKNGMSPQHWTAPPSQQIPDKNDILDMFVHVRRSGPNTTDSLWMMGAVSIENTTGNRYFDFEMYQTDIYFDRPSLQFYNYGPEAGHTAWQFDASGNVTRPGDIIFTAEYSSSALTMIEARIWIDRNSLSITPSTFDWSGAFDGDNNGSQYGYANITPKTAGAFYTGLQSGNNVWAGPFNLIREDNSIATNYIARQFMEFSVNLTKLGLDPVTLLGGDVCSMPFRRVLVKTRASTSFTAELKDFVGPFDLFLAPRVAAAADIPVFCGPSGISQLCVTNPSSSSVYSWSTADGNIIGAPSGTCIVVDAPGTYIVMQQLQAGCSPYAYDTITITRDLTCALLDRNVLTFSGLINENQVQLKWNVSNNDQVNHFDIERAINGYDFHSVGRVYATATKNSYQYPDDVSRIHSNEILYRLKMKNSTGTFTYSRVIRLSVRSESTRIQITPNPVKDRMQVIIDAETNSIAIIKILDKSGKMLMNKQALIVKGNNSINFTDFKTWSRGVYQVQVIVNNQSQTQKMLLMK